MTEVAHDTDAVVSSANGFRANRDVPEMATALHEGSEEYFGEDVTGRVTGLTTRVLGAALAIVRGEGAEAAYVYVGKADGKEELVEELEAAFEEAGFEDLEVSGQSVGPILPLLLGILAQSHDIEF